jgi:hypothetical protein
VLTEAKPLPSPTWGMVVLCLYVIWSGALYLIIKTLWSDARPPMEQRSILLLLLTRPISLELSW